MKIWKSKRKNKKIFISNDRIKIILAVIFLFAGALYYRLYKIQIIGNDYYLAVASTQHNSYNDLTPKRGGIYIEEINEKKEKTLFPVATNKEFAHIYAVPSEVKNPEKVAESLYDFFDEVDITEDVKKEFEENDKKEIGKKIKALGPMGDGELEKKKKEFIDQLNYNLSDKEFKEFRDLKIETEINKRKDEIIDKYKFKLSKKGDPYEPIKDRISDDKLKEFKKQNFPGIKYLMKQGRYYPEGSVFSHITGFLGYSGDSKKGLYGLEGFFNEELSGKEGSAKLERDAKGDLIIINDLEYKKQIDGADIILTIDRSIQFKICEMLEESVLKHGADSGSVIITNPATGEIITMCSYPNFSPNEYQDVSDISLFNNPVIYDQYEPGSTFKTITMAASLDMGKVTPNTTYFDKGRVMIDGWPKPIKNSDYETKGSHGLVNMQYVLEQSLNTGIIYAKDKMGDKIFADYVKKFGFGEKTGIELETEAEGNIRNLLRKKIRPIDSAVAAFGQGITVTPLQLVASYGAIANGGILMKPYLVKEIRVNDGESLITKPKEIRRVISEQTALILSSMLVNVIENGHAKWAGVDGYYLAGKTGTAQVADSDKRGYGSKTIHTFVGFGPVDDPKFVMLVKLDDPKDVNYSASSAAPLFGKMSNFILNYWQIEKERND